MLQSINLSAWTAVAAGNVVEGLRKRHYRVSSQDVGRERELPGSQIFLALLSDKEIKIRGFVHLSAVDSSVSLRVGHLP